MQPVVDTVVGETQVAKWVELDGRVAAVRRTLRAAAGFNRSGGQTTPYLLGEFAASGQERELSRWLNLDSMLVVDFADEVEPQTAVFVRTQRQLFGSVSLGVRRDLYLGGRYELIRQPKDARKAVYEEELSLAPGSTVTLFTRNPGPEPSVRYAGADMSLKRDFDAISEAVHFKG